MVKCFNRNCEKEATTTCPLVAGEIMVCDDHVDWLMKLANKGLL